MKDFFLWLLMNTGCLLYAFSRSLAGWFTGWTHGWCVLANMWLIGLLVC